MTRDANDIVRDEGVDALRTKFDEAGPQANGQDHHGLILSSRQFVEGFVPPDYLVDRILQRRFVYSLTGTTGSGKTAISLVIAASVALKKAIGDYAVAGGRALYFAGENPDDIRMRWIAMSVSMGFDVKAIPVHFIPGVFKISELEPRIRQELVGGIGDIDLVVVDTSAAYFEGDDDNLNVPMGIHARRLRGLSLLPGGPAVLVNCHPVKNATPDNLLPRGGGAFVAEMDGNLTSTKREDLVELHWQGKFRGPDFEPITFSLVSTKTDHLVDSKGRQIPTVVARPITEAERTEIEKRVVRAEDTLIVCMQKAPGAPMAALAEAADWHLSNGKPHKSKVHRLLKALAKDRLVKAERGTWKLSVKGVKEAERLIRNAEMTGSTYG